MDSALAMPARPDSAIWNWLPTFLAVAEAQSVVRASHTLGLTPQAVSRTVRLLEEHLGMPLFERRDKRLALNARGARLREATRHALERVDAALVDLKGDPYGGPLRIASLGVLTEHFVIPALIELKRTHTQALPIHFNLRPAEANEQLVRGRIDVAFYYEELSVPGLIVERLGQSTTSVYAGRSHPLFTKRKVSLEDVLAHPFSIPEIGDSGKMMDGWPAALPREAGMQITLLRSNLQVALSGVLLTVLPDVTAHPHVEADALRRLPVPPLPPIEVFAARRASVPSRGSAITLIEHVRADLGQSERVTKRVQRR